MGHKELDMVVKLREITREEKTFLGKLIADAAITEESITVTAPEALGIVQNVQGWLKGIRDSGLIQFEAENLRQPR
jgi:hypothetical protein